MKIATSKVSAVLTPMGRGSRVTADGVDISTMVDRITATTTADSGTRLELSIALCDCRVDGHGDFMAINPRTLKMEPVSQIVFKSGTKITFED